LEIESFNAFVPRSYTPTSSPTEKEQREIPWKRVRFSSGWTDTTERRLIATLLSSHSFLVGEDSPGVTESSNGSFPRQAQWE